MSTPEPPNDSVENGSNSIEQDSRNQKVLQNRLRKELKKQHIRFLQQQKEKQFFSQAPIHEPISVPSFSIPTPFAPLTEDEEEPILQPSASQRPFYNHEDFKSFPVSSHRFTPPTEAVGSGRTRKKKPLDPRIDFDYNTRSGFIPKAFDPRNHHPLSNKPLAIYRGNPESLEDPYGTFNLKSMADEPVLDITRTGRGL